MPQDKHNFPDKYVRPSGSNMASRSPGVWGATGEPKTSDKKEDDTSIKTDQGIAVDNPVGRFLANVIHGPTPPAPKPPSPPEGTYVNAPYSLARDKRK